MSDRPKIPFFTLLGLCLAAIVTVGVVLWQNQGPSPGPDKRGVVSVSGIKLGDRIEDVKERYPSLTCLDRFGRLWGPARASDVAIDLLFVEAENSVVTAVSGYCLEIEDSRFQRYDRVEELLKIGGVAQVVERKKTNHSVYQELYFPKLSLKVYVRKDAQEIIGEFTLGKPKRDMPEP